MARVDDNPSGIVFDDAGPGAGLKAPGVPKSADKIAQVAAKAKKTPGTQAQAAKPVAPVKLKKGTPQVKVITAERYKMQDSINAALVELGTGDVVAIAASGAVQNAYEVVIQYVV
jgi:hypothetical protein